MTCQYCGGAAPVPDVEARKKRQLVATPDPQDGYFIQEADRSKASAPGAGLMRGLIWSVVLLVGVGLPLRLTGVLDNLTEPLWGSYGNEQFLKASNRIRVNKFQQAGRAKVEQHFFTVKKHYVSLKPGPCYALVMGGGQPFKKVTLTDPKGVLKLSHEALRLHDTLVHCPTTAGAFTVEVSLDHPGRYIWALFRAPKQEAEMEGLLETSPRAKKAKKRRKRRRGKRKRRRRAREAIPPEGSVEPASQATGPTPAPPPAPRPPSEPVDDELNRAFKGSEINPDDL